MKKPILLFLITSLALAALAPGELFAKGARAPKFHSRTHGGIFNEEEFVDSSHSPLEEQL